MNKQGAILAKTLYVVFQGLISLVEFVAESYFIGYVVDMPEHKTAAGSWLCEAPMLKGDMFSLTVPGASGACSLDENLNLIVPATIDPKTVDSLGYCQIRLPKPDFITSYWTTSVGPSDFHNFGSLLAAPGAAKGPQNYSAFQVFQYTTGSPDQAILKRGSESIWKASMAPPNSGAKRNKATGRPQADDLFDVLHIYSAPEAPPADPNHYINEFNRSARLLGSNVTLTGKAMARGANPKNVPGKDLEPPKGLRVEELMQLQQRSIFVRPLVSALRRGVVLPQPRTFTGGDHIPADICGPLNGRV